MTWLNWADVFGTGFDYKLHFDRKKIHEEVEGNLYEEDGTKLDVSTMWNYKHAKEQFNGTFGCNFSHQHKDDKDATSFFAASELALSREADGSVAKKVTESLNVVGDKWNFGLKGVYQFGEGMQLAQMQTTYECSKDVFSWARADWKNIEGNGGASVFSVGSTYEREKMTASGELFFGPKNGEEAQEGFMGYPVWLNMGADIKFDDKTEANWSGTFAKDHSLHLSVNHTLDKNWSLGMHQHYYGSRLAAAEKSNPIDVGFNLNYKL